MNLILYLIDPHLQRQWLMVSVVINRYWLSSFHQGCFWEVSDHCRETREVPFPEHRSPPDSPLWLRNSLLSLKILLSVNSGLGCFYSAIFLLLSLFFFFKHWDLHLAGNDILWSPTLFPLRHSHTIKHYLFNYIWYSLLGISGKSYISPTAKRLGM